MVNIPHTILCCIDCYNYELSLRAIRRCMQTCHFEKVIFLSDRKFNYLENIQVITIPTIKTKEQYSIFVIKELNNYIDADFVLLVQYDGFIANSDSWITEFQNYDYIGAKWFWYTDGFNVGNGGFSLRSKRLLQALSEDNVPVSIESLKYGEDTFICRLYRRFLENRYGIKFAPEAVADKFSYERSDPADSPFGFHGLFNLWRHIKDEELVDFFTVLNPRTLNTVEVLELATNYYKAGKVSEAKLVCRRILESWPQNRNAQGLLAMIETRNPTGTAEYQ
jgi:hypothetical protein